MENLCKGMLLGLAVGMVVGGAVVAKNKKLQNKIKSCMSGASEKFEEAKDMIQEKIESQKEESNSSDSESMLDISSIKEMNKKSKK